MANTGSICIGPVNTIALRSKSQEKSVLLNEQCLALETR